MRISAVEKDDHWALSVESVTHDAGDWSTRSRRVHELSVALHDGSELQAMMASVLSAASMGGFATQVADLTVASPVGYDTTARRRWEIHYQPSGRFMADARVRLSTGSDTVDGEFANPSFADMQSALAHVVSRIGDPVFAAQIAAL